MRLHLTSPKSHVHFSTFTVRSTFTTSSHRFPRMPIPTPTASSSQLGRDQPRIFPALTVDQVNAALTSRWYSKFEDLTINTTIINLDSIGEKEVFLKVRISVSVFPGFQDQTERKKERSSSLSAHITVGVDHLPRTQIP